MSAVLGAERLSTSAVGTLARARNGEARALGGSQRGAPYVYDLLIRSADQTCAILQLRSCGSGVHGAAAADPSRAGATACPTMTAAGGPPCARSCSAASRAAHSCSAHARDAGAAVAAEPGATDPSGTTTPS